MRWRTHFLLALAVFVLGCASAQDGPGAVVQRYLAAKTIAEVDSLLSPGYRIWFGERTGAGMDRATALGMLEWDAALNSRHRVDDLVVRGNVVTARIHEDNDFSLLIGFPGWDSTSTYVVDESGRIASQVYVPRPEQPEWRPYLDAPLAWIREHRPEVLATIFPKDKLVRTDESAKEWVATLRAWRAATGQVDPTVQADEAWQRTKT